VQSTESLRDPGVITISRPGDQDSRHLARAGKSAGDVSPTYTLHATPSAQPERVTIEMSFSDFGAPVRVAVPPARDVFMP